MIRGFRQRARAREKTGSGSVDFYKDKDMGWKMETEPCMRGQHWLVGIGSEKTTNRENKKSRDTEGTIMEAWSGEKGGGGR